MRFTVQETGKWNYNDIVIRRPDAEIAPLDVCKCKLTDTVATQNTRDLMVRTMATLYAGKPIINKRPRNSKKGEGKTYTPSPRDQLYKKFNTKMGDSGAKWVKRQEAKLTHRKKMAAAKQSAKKAREQTALARKEARETAKAEREAKLKAAKEKRKASKDASKLLAELDAEDKAKEKKKKDAKKAADARARLAKKMEGEKKKEAAAQARAIQKAGRAAKIRFYPGWGR